MHAKQAGYNRIFLSSICSGKYGCNDDPPERQRSLLLLAFFRGYIVVQGEGLPSLLPPKIPIL
jgi:hypothetical protein